MYAPKELSQLIGGWTPGWLEHAVPQSYRLLSPASTPAGCAARNSKIALSVASG
jgi:hypothetical protein